MRRASLDKPYLQAVIDNFSRRILAWNVSESFDPTATAGLLIEASNGLLGEKPTLLTDGGGENHKGILGFSFAVIVFSRNASS